MDADIAKIGTNGHGCNWGMWMGYGLSLTSFKVDKCPVVFFEKDFVHYRFAFDFVPEFTRRNIGNVAHVEKVTQRACFRA